MKKLILLTSIVLLSFSSEIINKKENNNMDKNSSLNSFEKLTHEKYIKIINEKKESKYKKSYNTENVRIYDKMKINKNKINVFLPYNHEFNKMEKNEIEYQYCIDEDNSYFMFDKKMEFQLFIREELENPEDFTFNSDYKFLSLIKKEDCFKFLN
jgi:hypothetical protein